MARKKQPAAPAPEKPKVPKAFLIAWYAPDGRLVQGPERHMMLDRAEAEAHGRTHAKAVEHMVGKLDVRVSDA